MAMAIGTHPIIFIPLFFTQETRPYRRVSYYFRRYREHQRCSRYARSAMVASSRSPAACKN